MKYPPRPIYDMVQFLQDHGIDHSEHASTVTTGWVGIHCPFCAGSKNYHLGYNLVKGYWYCWRCKGKSNKDVLRALFGSRSEESARALVRYTVAGFGAVEVTFRRKKRDIRAPLELPTGTRPLSKRAADYLESRGFDPDFLEKTYEVQCTEAIGDYKFRIIIPVKQRNELVSFQGRDYTGRSAIKYKACPTNLEVIPHKDSLYGVDQVPGRDIVVVEGVTDVWKLGPGAVATFGIAYTPAQLRKMALFRRVYVLMDNDPDTVVIPECAPHAEFTTPHESRKAQQALTCQLSVLGVDVYTIPLRGYADPGEMTKEDARALMREIVR